MKVVKNKVAPPFQIAEFEILYGQGISKTGEILDLGVHFGHVQKSGSWYAYQDTKLGQGKEAARQLLEDHPELAEEIEALIRKEMEGDK